MNSDNALQGQVALVSGAARGIGASAAKLLAARGAAVHVSDILDCDDTVAAIKEAGGQAWGHNLDVRDRDGCAALGKQILEQHGRIDSLICNAGVCPPGTVAGQ